MKLSNTTPYAKNLKKSPQLRGIFLNHKNRLGKTILNLWPIKYFFIDILVFIQQKAKPNALDHSPFWGWSIQQ